MDPNGIHDGGEPPMRSIRKLGLQIAVIGLAAGLMAGVTGGVSHASTVRATLAALHFGTGFNSSHRVTGATIHFKLGSTIYMSTDFSSMVSTKSFGLRELSG